MNNSDNSISHKVNFLYAAINDSQAVIRGIDTKVSILIGVCILPVTRFDALYSHVSSSFVSISRNTSWFTSILIFLILISWVAGLISALRTILGIDNPSDQVAGTKPCGSYYHHHDFKLKWFNAFVGTKTKEALILSRKLDNLPASIENVVDELNFEHAKLAYIRSIKMLRMRYAFCLSYIWILSLVLLLFLTTK